MGQTGHWVSDGTTPRDARCWCWDGEVSSTDKSSHYQGAQEVNEDKESLP